MTKYLDSKGLSYLWQKIVHRFAQRDLTNSGKLVNGNIALWTDGHKLSGVTPKDLAGSVLAEEYIELPDGSLVQHVQTGLGTSNDKSGWELPKASAAFGVVATESTVSSTTGLTPLPIIDGKLYYRDSADYTHPVLNIEKTSTTGTPTHSGKFTIIDSLTFAETEGTTEKGHLVGYSTKEITLPAGYVHPTPTLTQSKADDKTLDHSEDFTVITGVTVNNEGHTTGITTTKFTLPAGYTHPDVTDASTISTAAPAHGGTFTVIDSVSRDAKGHVTGVNTKTVTLPTVPEVPHPIVGVDDPNAILHLDADKELYTSLKLNKVTDTDGALKIQILGSKSGSFPEGDIVSGEDYPLVTELDLTDLTKDSFLKSATIHTLSAATSGATASWDVTPTGGTVPTTPGTYIRFEWNVREDDPATTEIVETTVEYLNVTRLVSMYTAGNGINITDYSGNDGAGKNAKSISVKVDNTEPADGSTLVTLTAGNKGLSAKVDLSDYQKSGDLVAFTDTELDAIFAEAETLYNTNPVGAKWPTTE